MVLGIAVGVALGATFHSIAIGVAVGVAMGALWISLAAKRPPDA